MDTLTFGIELEFICVRPETLFDPYVDPPYDGCEGDRGAGPAIWAALNRNGIPSVGWEDDWEPIPTHSRWRVEDDKLFLSEEEQKLLPDGWEADNIEISSRKLRFGDASWREELAAVLQVLREVESRGCRFITNASSGLHVHVGFSNGVIVPLRVAQNVFQLFTAFERLIDELHASQRVALPEDTSERHVYYPLSFFHTYGAAFDPSKGAKSSLLLDRLYNIEVARSYEDLGSFFNLERPEIGIGVQQHICGHNSSVNFDNLFPKPELDRYPENLTGTIEFRQHTGSLDYLDIMAWTTLVCRTVLYCYEAPSATLLDLMIRGVDPGFTLGDFLTAIGRPADVRDHYLNNGGSVIGVLPVNSNAEASQIDPTACALIEQNDHECEERASVEHVRAAIEKKSRAGFYGLDAKIKLSGAISAAAALREVSLHVRKNGICESSEEGVLLARARVLGKFAQQYRSGTKCFEREA